MLRFGPFLAFLIWAQPAGGPSEADVEREVAACQSRCATEPGMSETDRASCKLQCTSTRRAAQLRKDGVRQTTGGSRAGASVSSQPSTTPTSAPSAGPATTGYTTVIEQTKSPGEIAACQLGCDQAGLESTDRATCKLNCAATTRIVHVVPVGPAPGGASGPSTAASPPGTPAPTSSGAGTGAAPTPSSGAALAACLDGCVGLVASDKVTCRLNCESAHHARVSAAPSTAPPVQRPGAQPSSSVVHRSSGDPSAVAGCERSCDARLDLSSTDKATCKLGCSRHTTVVVEQWTSSAPASPSACQAGCQCAERCTGHRHACEQSCSGKSGGDAATCKLQCEATFNSCHNACKVDGCSCSAGGH